MDNIKRVDDLTLKEMANAAHRGFNPWPDKIFDLILDLMDARSLTHTCHLCERDIKLPCRGARPGKGD